MKFEKSPKSTHPTVYTLHKTLCTQQIVPHAADRCAVILVPAFWGNSPRNKDEGRLLFILYRYIFFDPDIQIIKTSNYILYSTVEQQSWAMWTCTACFALCNTIVLYLFPDFRVAPTQSERAELLPRVAQSQKGRPER